MPTLDDRQRPAWATVSAPAGTLLGGRYRLDVVIGHGGMSTVYRAQDMVLERPVAIKVLNREIATDADQLERFRREARAVAQLSHPHIVTVIDAAEDFDDPDGPAPYIVFAYVDGETLKDRIRREHELPITDAVAYAIEIARALGMAHEHHIVHRDVKPQNVLLDAEGSAKITDFGIARTLTEEGLTAHGRVLGTTDYVSPEQALGHPVTGQSDIYSLGIVLYEMLTGDVPFHGDSAVAVAMRHVREEVPDVQQRRPGVSAALAAVVDRATAKDLARRYPDTESLVADLEEVLAIEAARSGGASGEATSVLRSLPEPTRRRLPINLRYPAALLVALLAIGAVVGVVLYVIASNTHRGVVPATPPVVVDHKQLEPVPLAQSAAHDYDPYGDGHEDRDQVALVVDGDASTAWSTEHYFAHTLSPKPGVGVYIDARPGVAASKMELQTPTPGFGVRIYAADSAPARFHSATADDTGLAQLGWGKPIGSDPSVRDGARLTLDTDGHPYRYYLVWIDSLPPHSASASISEITLFH